MQEKAKEPEIRFAGFTGAWEQRKFGEMANRRSEVSASGNLPRVEYEDIVSGTGTLNKDVFEKQSQKQGIVFHSGDVLYGKLRPYLQNWLLASFNGLAVGDFWVLEPQGLNSNYLYRIIQTKQFDEIANQSVGTKMPRADWKLVSKATFLNPASFNEQRLIGKFFKDIDSLLTLHQRKYEKLLNIKKSMLEKMFPKEGEVVPEIRFKGFTGAWEQRKFSELYKRSSEKNDGSMGVDRFITVATMQFKSDIRVTEDEYLKTYFTFKLGDIAFEGNRSKNFKYGRFVENDIGDGLVSHVFIVMRPITNYDLYFWKYAIHNENLMRKILQRSTKSSTMMHDLVVQDFLNEKFSVPSLKEQKAIGNFLRTIDSLLTLHQRKLEMLKNVKQAFLEKMFV